MVGIDLDLLAAIAEDQGFEYEIKSLGFSAAVTALEAKQVDGVIAGMSITEEREEKYDFSEPYYDSGVGMAVKADSDIDSYEDLEGETVIVKMGTESQSFAEANADKYGWEVKIVEGSDELYQDVLVGNSAACFDDYPVLGFEISRGKALKMPLPMEQGSSYGFATLKGENPKLVEMFNAGLENLKESGKYDEILNTYITTEAVEETETEEVTEAEETETEEATEVEETETEEATEAEETETEAETEAKPGVSSKSADSDSKTKPGISSKSANDAETESKPGISSKSGK